jgi:rod shape-determining protein MreD
VRLPRTTAEWLSLFDLSWRVITPTILVLPLIALMALPIDLAWQPWMPQFGLIAVMFWVIHRPNWMPPLAAMALGLVQDVWCGSPLGLMMFIYGMVAALLPTQNLFFQARPFHTCWAILAALLIVIEILLWAGTSAMIRQVLPLWGFALQAALSIAMVPPVHLCLTFCHARLADRRPTPIV